ncbi:MAG: CvpA family protein [Candidatus Limnocylindrus sp.]|jgi:uncharacterized membrane protein required for colicin V production
MNLAVAADAVILFGVVLTTWSGWRTGAARMIVSTLAAVVGIFLAAQGRAPLADLISRLFPDADDVLISLLILVGASWIFLGLLSWLLGNLLRGVLRTIRLGLVDDVFGALLGLLQGLLMFSALLFLLQALTGVSGLPAPLVDVAQAAQGSQGAGLLRDTVFPLLWSLAGASLPSELQQILRP